MLSRARRKVLVVDAGAPRNAPAAHMHGYLSRDGMPPAELLAVGRDEVRSYGGEIVDGTVTDLVPDGPGFTALLASGQRISARRLLVTTGLRDELPDIPGLRDRWARDVLHCPYCHGHEVRDRRLGVIGGTPGAVRYAQIVRQWTGSGLLHPARHPHRRRTNPAVRPRHRRRRRHHRPASSSTGPTSSRACRWTTAASCPRDALFVPPRFVPNSALLVGLGCDVDPDGWVTVDSTGRTSVPGVWAAGNIVDPRAQVITAAGAGSAAAIALNADLVEDDVRTAVRDLDHGFAPCTHHDRTIEGVSMTTPPPRPTAPRFNARQVRTTEQTPTRPDDLAGGLPDPARPQPDSG